MRKGLIFLVASIFLQVSLTSTTVHAQDTATLGLITTTADRICGVVKDSGSATSAEAKGAVKVEVNGLISQLVTAGAEGSGGISSDTYVGPVREQLAALLTTTQTCKLEVLRLLWVKLGPGNAGSALPPPAQQVAAAVQVQRAPPVPPPPSGLPCQVDRMVSWLDQHGIYGNRNFDVTAYDSQVNWIVNGKSEWKTQAVVQKEEDDFKKVYPMQRYSPVPNTSGTSMSGGQCVLTQDIGGYKQKYNGKIENNSFRFIFYIVSDSNSTRIVARETNRL